MLTAPIYYAYACEYEKESKLEQALSYCEQALQDEKCSRHLKIDIFYKKAKILLKLFQTTQDYSFKTKTIETFNELLQKCYKYITDHRCKNIDKSKLLINILKTLYQLIKIQMELKGFSPAKSYQNLAKFIVTLLPKDKSDEYISLDDSINQILLRILVGLFITKFLPHRSSKRLPKDAAKKLPKTVQAELTKYLDIVTSKHAAYPLKDLFVYLYIVTLQFFDKLFTQDLAPIEQIRQYYFKAGALHTFAKFCRLTFPPKIKLHRALSQKWKDCLLQAGEKVEITTLPDRIKYRLFALKRLAKDAQADAERLTYLTQAIDLGINTGIDYSDICFELSKLYCPEKFYNADKQFHLALEACAAYPQRNSVEYLLELCRARRVDNPGQAALGVKTLIYYLRDKDSLAATREDAETLLNILYSKKAASVSANTALSYHQLVAPYITGEPIPSKPKAIHSSLYYSSEKIEALIKQEDPNKIYELLQHDAEIFRVPCDDLSVCNFYTLLLDYGIKAKGHTTPLTEANENEIRSKVEILGLFSRRRRPSSPTDLFPDLATDTSHDKTFKKFF